MNLESFPLHDAILKTVQVDWESRTCTLNVNAIVKRDEDAVPCELTFQGLKKLVLPVELPWGHSVFINQGWRAVDGTFCVEMQSGDVVFINATTATFVQK